MLDRFRSATYLVALKWKQGEARAIGTMRRPARQDLLVLFDIPPAGDFDHDLGRVPDTTEYIKLFGPRLLKHCGTDPVFVDARLIDDDRHREGFARHPLTELLERGRLAGAHPCPVTGLNRLEAYQAAVGRFAKNHAPLPVCLRLEASDLERGTLAADISTLLDQIQCEPGRVFVVVDLGGRQLAEN